MKDTPDVICRIKKSRRDIPLKDEKPAKKPVETYIKTLC